MKCETKTVPAIRVGSIQIPVCENGIILQSRDLGVKVTMEHVEYRVFYSVVDFRPAIPLIDSLYVDS
jgi:hypothetical protein